MKVTLNVMDERIYRLINSEEDIETIVSGMHLTEGAVWDYERDMLLFNDFPILWVGVKRPVLKCCFITERKQMASVLILREDWWFVNMR